MERHDSLLLFDANDNVQYSHMTDLEQWKVVLPNFRLHAQSTILSYFFDFLGNVLQKAK